VYYACDKPFPREFTDVSKGYVSFLRNAFRQVDLYMRYQKCAEYLQNETCTDGEFVWMNDVDKEDILIVAAVMTMKELSHIPLY
jgi:hypothetical protein